MGLLLTAAIVASGSGVPRNFVWVGGRLSKNSIEGRETRDLGAVAP